MNILSLLAIGLTNAHPSKRVNKFGNKTSFVLLCWILCSTVSPIQAETLFFDDFSNGFGQWTLESPEYWSIVDGWLDVCMPNIDYTFAKAFAGDVNWTDYRVEFDVLGLTNSAKIFYFRYQNENTGYFLNFRGPVPAENDPGAVRLFRLDDTNCWPHGCWATLQAVPYPNNVGNVYHLAIEVVGAEIRIFVDGQLVLDYVDVTAPVYHGSIGFAGFTGANFYNGNHVRWDNIMVISTTTVSTSGTSWGSLKSLFR